MNQIFVHYPPIRITDLVELKKEGASISCSAALDIIPIDFSHRQHHFRALVFIGRFSGTADNQPYTFRKCYARGCKHDLCPRVSQAVMTANRFLQRDYHRLGESGIGIKQKLFTLEDSVVRLTTLRDDPRKAMILDDYIHLAQDGGQVTVHVDLEYVPAIEHFEYHQNNQTFLLADFTITAQGETYACQRCLGCYPSDREKELKPVQIGVANDRLSHLYGEFDQSSIRCEPRYFAC
jgi:hypothetical protein